MMVVVLTFLSAVSGGLLAAIKDNTKERIEYQQLKFVKGPAILTILKGAANDPITDRFKIADGDVERSFFVGVFDGKAHSAVQFGGTRTSLADVALVEGETFWRRAASRAPARRPAPLKVAGSAPVPFQLTRHDPVFRLHDVVLALRALGVVLGTLDLKLPVATESLRLFS